MSFGKELTLSQTNLCVCNLSKTQFDKKKSLISFSTFLENFPLVSSNLKFCNFFQFGRVN